MELHSIGDKSGRENEGPRRTAFFPWRNTQAEQSEGKPQCEGVAPVHVGQQDLQTPLPFLNTVPPFPKVAKSRDPSFAGFSSPFSEPQFIQSWQQKTPTPQEELGDKPPARGGRFTGTVVQTAPPERDAFAAAAAGLAAALSPQSGAASAFSTGKTPKPPGLRKETATDPLEPPSAWEGSAARMTSGSFSRHGSSNGRGGGPFEGPMKCQDVQKLGANGMPDGGGEQRGSWKEGALQNHGRKTAPLQERLGGSVEGGVPDWDAALFGEPRSGQKESRRNGAPARGAPGVDLGMRARVAGVQDQEAGRAQQSSESWRRDSEGSGVDEVGLAGAGAHYQMRAVNNAAGKPSEGESFQEVRMGRNGRSSLSQGQVARQGTDQGAEGGTMKRENWHHREGGGLEDGRRKRGGSSVNASLNARDVLQQQTEMLALMQKQVDLLQALLVKQQPATKPVANPPPAAAVTTTAVNTSLLRPNPTTRSEPHPLGRAIARRQVAEIGTNTSIVWPAPVHTHNGWSSAHVRSTSRGAGEGFSQRGAKAGYSQDEESEAFRKNVSESRTRDRGGLGDATHERVRQGGVGEVRAEPTFEKVQQVAFYQTDYRPKSAEQPPQSSAVETAHKASRFGVESGEPRQRASADVSTGGRGHASGQLPVVPSAWGAGTGVRKNTAAERPEFGVGRNGFTDGEPQGDVSAQRGDVRGDVMEGEEQGWLSSRSSSASSLVLSELGAPLVERTGEDGNFESWRGVGEEAVHAQHLETGSGERSAQGVESLPHGGEMREQSNGSGGIPESESGARWDGFPAVRNRSGAVKNGSGARGKGLAATRNGLEGVEEVRSGAGLAKAAADSLESLKGSTAGRVGARDRDVGEGSRDKGFRSETRNDLQVVRRSKGKLGEEREYCRQGERVEKAVLGGGWGAGTGAPVLKAHLLDIPQIKYMPLSDDEDSDAEETAGRFRTADGVPRGFSVTNGGTSDGLGGQGGRMSGSEGRANVVVPRGSLQERGGFEKERTIERSGLDMTHDGSTYLADLSVDSRRYLTQHGLLQTRSRPPALRPLDEDRVLRNQDPDDSLEMSERGLETGVDATVYEGRGVWGESGGGVQEERSRILRSAQIEECDSSMFLSGTEVRLGGTAGAVSLWANGSVAEGSTLPADVSHPGSAHSDAPPLAAEASGNLLEAVRRKRLPKLR